MICYICQDTCSDYKKKCNCEGYISYIHEECLLEMIYKTNNYNCYFCDSEYKLNLKNTTKINLIKIKDKYFGNFKLNILLFLTMFLFYLCINDIRINFYEEIYYEMLIDSEII